ncbi:MAG: hypothetical protein ABI844_01530 [Saprospiraceae bacterium]
MPNRFTKAAKLAADATNKELTNELSSITSLRRENFDDLLPSKKDKEAFIKLMEQVEADTEMDLKLAFLQDNIASVGSVAFKLLKFLV